MTALHYAVQSSQMEVVKKAVEQKADVKARDKFGWTPLMRGGKTYNKNTVVKAE